MDVRAADTSVTAAKRLEMDGVRPVGDKSGYMQEHLAAQASKTGGHVNKARDRKERRGRGQPQDDSPEDPGAGSEEHLYDGTASVLPGDEHVLDVRV